MVNYMYICTVARYYLFMRVCITLLGEMVLYRSLKGSISAMFNNKNP